MARKPTSVSVFAEELQAVSEGWAGRIQFDRRRRRASINIMSIDEDTLRQVIKATAARLP